MNITAEDVKNAQRDGKVFFFKNAFEDTPTWSDFEEMFDSARNTEDLIDGSIAGTNICNSELHTNTLDAIVDSVSSIHQGEKIMAMSIFHFYSRNDSKVPNEAQGIFAKFKDFTKEPMTEDFNYEWLTPTIHSDPVDGFFIQCEGKTLWNVYYGDSVEEFLAEPGDSLFIPKGIDHSVESMGPRASVSISFFE